MRREGARRRVGDAPRLAQHPHGRIDHTFGQDRNVGWENQGVGRERNAPFSNTESKVETTTGPARRIHVEVRRRDLACDLGAELELEHSGTTRQDGRNRRRGVQERGAAHGGRIELNGHIVARRLPDVRDRRADRELLLRTHDRRHGEGHVEGGVADEHAACCLALHRDRADRQPEELGLEVEANLMEALLLAAQQELGLRLLSWSQPVDVVGCPGLAIGAKTPDFHRKRLGEDPSVALDRGQGERIVGCVERQVGAGRQLHRRLDRLHVQIRANGRAIGDVELCREELLEEADIPWDHQDRGNGDGLLDTAGCLEFELLAFPARAFGLHEEREDCRKLHALARGSGGRAQRLRNRDTLAVEDDREREIHSLGVELETHRELESEVVVAVEDDALAADLIECQGAGRHLRHEDLIDDLERHGRGFDVEDDAASGHDPQVVEAVHACDRRGRCPKHERIV